MSLPAYTIRKLPRVVRRRRRGNTEVEYAIFDPAGQYVAGASYPRGLFRLVNQLNDAYELGRVTERLRKFGRQQPHPAGEEHLRWVRSLPYCVTEHDGGMSPFRFVNPLRKGKTDG